jgi:threonyl-tRNA synthetase
MERFMACLIEQYAGAFPLWLAPVQTVIIPIADRHLDYAQRLSDELMADDIRVQIDGRTERMNLKIREAQMMKVPYMLIIGDKEEEDLTVSVRLRSGDDLGSQPISELKARIKSNIMTRSLDKL